MGVEHIIKLLQKECGAKSIKEYDLSELKDLTVAVDISLMTYQTVIAMRGGGADLVNSKGELTSHLSGIFTKLVNFLANGIKPICVFDGKPPEIKVNTSNERDARRKLAQKNIDKMGKVDTNNEEYIKNFKNTFKPTKENFTELQIMLDLMGIPYICAPGEADVICSWLATRTDSNGKRWAKGVCSDDSDMLTFGSPYLFKNMLKFLTGGKKVTVISLEKSLVKLNITMDQFVDLCALYGCDHCDGIPKVGMVKGFEQIVEHEKLEKILKLHKEKNPELKEECKAIIKARDYFRDALNDIDNSNFKVTDLQTKLRLYQRDELIDFLCVKHGLDLMKIEAQLNKLEYAYRTMEIKTPNTGFYHKIRQQRSEDYKFMSESEEYDLTFSSPLCSEEKNRPMKKDNHSKTKDKLTFSSNSHTSDSDEYKLTFSSSSSQSSKSDEYNLTFSSSVEEESKDKMFKIKKKTKS